MGINPTCNPSPCLFGVESFFAAGGAILNASAGSVVDSYLLAWTWAETSPGLWRIEYSTDAGENWVAWGYISGELVEQEILAGWESGTEVYFRVIGCESVGVEVTPYSNAAHCAASVWEPALDELSPNPATAGEIFNLIVTGSNFSAAGVLTFDGVPDPVNTQFISDTEMRLNGYNLTAGVYSVGYQSGIYNPEIELTVETGGPPAPEISQGSGEILISYAGAAPVYWFVEKYNEGWTPAAQIDGEEISFEPPGEWLYRIYGGEFEGTATTPLSNELDYIA